MPTACSTQAGLSKLEAELETMLDDPTLQSCCRRDIMQQKRSTKLRAQLLAVDRTEVRLQHRNAVALLAGPMQAQQQQQPEQSDEESSLSGSDDDQAGGLSGGASMSMRMAHGAWSRLHACMQADGDRLRLGAPARMDRQNPCTLFLRCMRWSISVAGHHSCRVNAMLTAFPASPLPFFDAELQRLRHLRLEALQKQQQQKDTKLREGYGRLNTLPYTQLAVSWGSGSRKVLAAAPAAGGVERCLPHYTASASTALDHKRCNAEGGELGLPLSNTLSKEGLMIVLALAFMCAAAELLGCLSPCMQAVAEERGGCCVCHLAVEGAEVSLPPCQGVRVCHSIWVQPRGSNSSSYTERPVILAYQSTD